MKTAAFLLKFQKEKYKMTSKVWGLGLALLAMTGMAQATTCPSQLKVGNTFQVTLQTNASTGFQWKVHEQSANIVLVKTETHSAPAQGNAPVVGAPSRQTWTFKAASAGNAAVHLVYVRPWQVTDVAEQWVCRVVIG